MESVVKCKAPLSLAFSARTYVCMCVLASTLLLILRQLSLIHDRGFQLYVTITQSLCTHHFLRCCTAGFVQSMFVLMDV